LDDVHAFVEVILVNLSFSSAPPITESFAVSVNVCLAEFALDPIGHYSTTSILRIPVAWMGSSGLR
jgi:hypothetical protein